MTSLFPQPKKAKWITAPRQVSSFWSQKASQKKEDEKNVPLDKCGPSKLLQLGTFLPDVGERGLGLNPSLPRV